LRDFAEVIGVNAMTVQRWETGEVQPRLDHAVAYRHLLDQIREATDENTQQGETP
jgi:DNA-binding transcriptional regulator YiaG